MHACDRALDEAERPPHPETTRPPASPAPGEAHSRRARTVITPLIILLLLWLWLFQGEGAFRGGPSGKAFGADFGMFLGAAQVMKDGGNAYDHVLLYRTEQRLMQRQGLPMTTRKQVVRVGNPPLFFWALQPLTALPFQAVALVWMLSLFLASALGFLAILSWLGWTRLFVPTLVFLLLPQTFLGVFYGNIINLVFAAIAVALVLMKRHPLPAGALLALAWLKPPVALPIVLLIVLFHAPHRLRLAAGFALTTILLVGLTLVTAGPGSMILWVHGLLGYSHDMAIQPDVASLAGVYVRWAPAPVRMALETAVLAVALTLTGVCWWRLRDRRDLSPLSLAWLWVLWFLATPYAHFFDEMLLAVPLLAFVGRDGINLPRRRQVTALYLTFFSLVVINPTPFHVFLLSLPVVAIAVLLYLARETPETSGNPTRSVLTLTKPQPGPGS